MDIVYRDKHIVLRPGMEFLSSGNQAPALLGGVYAMNGIVKSLQSISVSLAISASNRNNRSYSHIDIPSIRKKEVLKVIDEVYGIPFEDLPLHLEAEKDSEISEVKVALVKKRLEKGA